MLTEAEKKWLETRLQNLKVSGWFSCTEGELIPLVNFHRKHFCSDWEAAAEFEARVAAQLAARDYIDLCADRGECEAPHFAKYNTKTEFTGCNMCVHCVVRLAVESEMAKEGK